MKKTLWCVLSCCAVVLGACGMQIEKKPEENTHQQSNASNKPLIPEGEKPFEGDVDMYTLPQEVPSDPPVMPGGDRDEHGCIPSAGYEWSEEKQMCVRPWEEKNDD